MTRTARFLGGLSFGYLHLVAVTVVGLWLTPFLLRHIGQHDLGLWLIITQIVNFLGLLDLGVVTLLPRETAYVAGTRPVGERPQLAPLVARVWRIVLLQVPVVVLAAIGAWWWVPADWAAGRLPLLLVIVAFVGLFPARVFNALLQGIQDLAFVGRVQLLTWAASTAITVAFVLAGARLYAVVLGWMFAQAASAAASALRVRRLVPEAFTWMRLDRGDREALTYLKRSAWIGVSQIAQVLLAGTDMLVIGRLLGPAAVVPYSCTTKLVTVLANHPHLLMHAAAPALSEMRAGGSRDRLAELSTALTIAMLVASGAIASVILAGNQLFVGWWVGADQFAGWPLTVAAVLMMLLRHWNTASTYALFCFGHDRRISLTMLGDGVVTLGSTLLLVPMVGAIGAPLGSILGVLCVALPCNLLQIGRDLQLAVWRVMSRVAPWALRMCAAGAIAALLAWELAGDGFLGLAGGAAASGAIYAALIAPIVLRPPLRGFFLPAVETVRRAATGWRIRYIGTPRPRESQAE
jgi:O-antigen/teichoic acid export membrane protein